MKHVWIGIGLIIASYVLTAVSVLVFISSFTKTAITAYASSWACFIYGTFLGGKRGIVLLKDKILQNE